MKYFFIRNYYLLFRKSEIMKIIMHRDYVKIGETYIDQEQNKVLCVGNNYFIKL